MKKVGLYFGTFNPIHIGHLILGNHFVETTNLSEVWFVITPQNPQKQKKSILPNYQRLELVYRAINDYPKLKPCDIEFSLPVPNYTCNTLAYLEEKYSGYSFSLLIGEDNWASFHKWKNYETILKNYQMYVYPRFITNKNPNGEINNHSNVKKIDAPKIEISSSFIRQAIKKGENIRPLLPYEVWKYLDEMNFYKK